MLCFSLCAGQNRKNIGRGVHPTWEGFAGASTGAIFVPGTAKTSLHRGECGLQKLTASGTGRSHRASVADPVSGTRNPRTFPARGEVSAWSGKPLLEHLPEPSWVLDPAKTSLHR